MSITIELPADVECRLRAWAAQRGQDPAAVVVEAVELRLRAEAEASLEPCFAGLAATWKRERGPHSSAARLADHPAYRAIVALGPPVVPLILRELEKQPDHWFLALHELTGANPVPEADRGRVPEMAALGSPGAAGRATCGNVPIHLSLFPALAATGYHITSPPEPSYNCIAWAATKTDAWWWPDTAGFEFWPAGIPRDETLDAFVAAFATLGYGPCTDAALEPAWEKVALYTLSGRPTHAARQLPSGRWTSKLGPEDDIEHTLDGLVGPCYGTVAIVLRRVVSATP